MNKKRLHIFLVDDDADDRMLFQEAMMEVDPLAKLSLADGCDMLLKLTKVEKDIPDMIFLDLNMPGLNGFECLEEIKNKQQFGDVPTGFSPVGNVAGGWRWRWDLNPRTACTVTRFRGVLLRPLGHATAAEITGRRGAPGKRPAAARSTQQRAHRPRPRAGG